MGHNHHRDLPASLHPLAWYDGLIVAATAAMVVLHAELASYPVLFGVLAALVVGMAVHRLFAWMERDEEAREESSPHRSEAGTDQPRHSARAA